MMSGVTSVSYTHLDVYKRQRLQRALINFFLDEAIEAGYKEVQVPHLVNTASGFGTGQLPDKELSLIHI